MLVIFEKNKFETVIIKVLLRGPTITIFWVAQPD